MYTDNIPKEGEAYQNGVAVNGTLELLDVHLVGFWIDVYVTHMYIEVLSALVEGCVHCAWHNDIRLGDALVLPSIISECLHCHADGLGSTGGHGTAAVAVAMEQCAGHADHFGFHFTYAREEIDMQGIRVGCLAVNLRYKLYQLWIVAVYGTRDATITPAVVSSLKMIVHKAQNLFLAQTLFR